MDTLIGIFGGLVGLIFMVAFMVGFVVALFAITYYGIQFLAWVHSLGPPQIPVPAGLLERHAEIFRNDDESKTGNDFVDQDEQLEQILGTESPSGVDHIYLEDAPPLAEL